MKLHGSDTLQLVRILQVTLSGATDCSFPFSDLSSQMDISFLEPV